MFKIIYSFAVAVLHVFGWLQPDDSIRVPCPCSDPSWCEPISKTPLHEVFTFTFVGNETSWSKFDWNKVTTVVSGLDNTLTCYAHKHGARSTVLVDYTVANLLNTTARKEWIKLWLKNVQDNFMDGLNIDVEESIPKDRPDLKEAYTTFMKEINTAFKSVNPNYQITVDVTASYNPHCSRGRCYDYLGLSNYSDFLVLMDYDMGGGNLYPRSNSPYHAVENGLESYLKLGIPKEKIVIALPWYGDKYPCVSVIGSKCRIDHNKRKYFGQVKYKDIMKFYSNSSTTGILWSNASLTPYFNFKYQNITFQVQYDDPFSLKLKYDLAVNYQLRGVSMWDADMLDYYSNTPEAIIQTAEMWKALPDYDNNKLYFLT